MTIQTGYLSTLDPRTAPLSVADIGGLGDYAEILPARTILSYTGPRERDMCVTVRHTQAPPAQSTTLGPWIYGVGARLPQAQRGEGPPWSRRVETEILLSSGTVARRYVLTGSEIRLRTVADSVTVRMRLTHHVRHTGAGPALVIMDPRTEYPGETLPPIVSIASVGEGMGVTEDALIYTDAILAFAVGQTYVSPIPVWARRIRATSGGSGTQFGLVQASWVTGAPVGQSLRSSAVTTVTAHDTYPDQIVVPSATHALVQVVAGSVPQVVTLTYSGRIQT